MRLPLPALLAVPSIYLLHVEAAAAGEVSLFLGAPGGVGDVAVFDEAGSGAPSFPPGLQGIRLLPVELVGRTRLERFLPDRARLEADIPGAGRLALPLGQGSLYRFERPGAGGSSFGLMLVGADGAARSVLELPGTGAAADADPFLPPVAVSPLGEAVLLGTAVEAGGNALELDLATGIAQDRSANLPPLALSPSGLGLRAEFGVAIHASGVLRFDRLPGALAFDVPLAGAPAWFGGEVVFSADGQAAATIAGASPTAAVVHAFGRTGAASAVSAAPASLSPAGFLPDQLDGPYLSLSGDGSVALWRTEGASREAWMARTQPVAGDQEHQLTADANYLDTLDEVGLVGPQTLLANPDAMVVAVGERRDPVFGGIEGLDLYRVTLKSGVAAPQYENLTLSSGDAQVPFLLKSTIDPEDGAWRAPGADRVLLHDGDGERLLLVDAAAGTSSVLMDLVKSTDVVACGAGAFLLSVRRSEPIKKRQLLCVDPLAGTAKVLGTMPDTVVLSRLTVRPDGWTGLVLENGLSQWLVRVHASSGTAEVLTYLPVSYGATLAWSPGGRLLVSGALGASPPVFVGWGLGVSPALYPTSAPAGFVLPGA